MSLRSLRALCLTSFFIADVRDGLGPFLGIFLTQRHWQAEDIGLLMTVGGVAGLLATLPAGFITDTSRHKRVLLAGVCLAITLTTLLLWFSQKTSVVALSQVASGICAAFVGPLIAGITLGLTRQRGFSAQMGKNEAFNHAGNFFTALIAGAIAWYWGIGGIFIGQMLRRFLHRGLRRRFDRLHQGFVFIGILPNLPFLHPKGCCDNGNACEKQNDRPYDGR